ncbi:MAG: alpha-L-arabinofuranosidase C-terminal domain-containing protein [Paludibacter sp.]|nr:alpha-L-arabinofuranosidase C-terminal domain-containing protein [Paludibacter sp.]
MKKLISTGLFIGFFAFLQAQTSGNIQIQVNASKQIATVTKMFNGTNIEDLNNQTNGGIFSQLIHGEAFEENIDIDFLHLPLADYVKVYVILDETRRPHLLSVANSYTRVNWNNLGEKYDFNSKDIYNAVEQATQPRRMRNGETTQPQRPLQIGNLKFYGRFDPYDSIPEDIRTIMLDRINGNEQISRYWNKIATGDTKGRFILKRGDAYMGRQDQIINLQSGNGEFGLYNSGLNKQGINLVNGKPYDGILRIKAQKATTIYLSLRDEQGKILAEKPYQLKGDGTFEKVEFELTPTAETAKGRFGITLKEQGEIELGFAFLEPGKWGRVKGYPIRKQFVDALVKEGIKVIRYNGSMVDVGADTYMYRWKKMIGPVDERRVCFRSGFNPYATHSFGMVELCQFAEAVGAQAMIGMSMDETSADIRDFVEYMNGAVTTKWGKLRATHGHPEPYNLKYIEVDNERPMTRGYIECMKKFALAAWKVDPEMHIMASLNIGTNPASYERGGDQYKEASEMFGWFVSQGKSDRMVWDPHYAGYIGFGDNPEFLREMGVTLQTELAKDFPGHKLTLCPMEENGSRCDWDRGLAHAHNWNTLQRNGNAFTALGTANTFQPHGQQYMWDQGRVHFTSSEIWYQPSAFIDEMMTSHWLPNVIEASSSVDSVLDVTAKINDKKDSLSLYVVNITDKPRNAVINVDGFRFSGKASTWVIGDCELTAYNTVDNKENVAPKTGSIIFRKKDASYTFPKYSYTVITLRK